MSVIERKRKVYEQFQHARFAALLSQPASATPKSLLLSLLAGGGMLAPLNRIVSTQAPVQDAEGPARAPEPMLQCAHCNALIPFAVISGHTPHTAAALTRDLLVEVFAPQHVEQCAGRLTGQLFNEGNVAQAVHESRQLRGTVTIWLGSRRQQEEMELVFSGLETHPEITARIVATFPPFSREIFKSSSSELSLPQNTGPHSVYYVASRSHPRMTALNFFFGQSRNDPTRPEQSQIPYVNAPSREVPYDRGATVNPLDIEAKEMADCRKRHDSYSKSDVLKETVAAYQLAQLGFFFIGNRNSPGELRCSFCRRTMQLFAKPDAPYLNENFERCLVNLLHLHAQSSPRCPFSLGLNGDDKRLSSQDVIRILEPLVSASAINFHRINESTFPHVYNNLFIRSSMESILSQCAGKLAPLDGPYADLYYNLFAEHEYDQNTVFENDPQFDFENEWFATEDLKAHATPMNYYTDKPPKSPDYIPEHTRVESFKHSEWERHPLSKVSGTSFLNPSKFARAGFFYAGKEDYVECFWCGVSLYNWKETNDPVKEHVRFSTRCPWLLRLHGRQYVKGVLKGLYRRQAGVSGVLQVREEENAFLREVEDIPGGLDPDQLCPVDYRFETRVVKARIDLPTSQAIIEELGFSVELLQHAFESQLKETGDDFQSAEQLLETLWAYDESKTEKKIESDADFMAQAVNIRRLRSAPQRERSWTTGSLELPQPEGSCSVCSSRAPSVVLIPCGHYTLCQSCYENLQQCPHCQSEIRGAVRPNTT